MDFSKVYFGKFAPFINVLFCCSLLIITSAMFAGVDGVASVLGINNYLVIIITFALCYVAVLGKFQRLQKINIVLVPIMLTMILSLCIGNMGKCYCINGSFVASIMSASSYVFINIVTLGVFILELGKNYSRKQKIYIALIVSIIISISLIVIVNAINNSGVVFSTMPILELSCKIGVLSKFIALCIWFGILTTLMSNVYVLSGYIDFGLHNRKLSTFITLLFSVIFSRIGFGIIVKYVYLLIGVVGLVITIVVCKKEIENSKITIPNK